MSRTGRIAAWVAAVTLGLGGIALAQQPAPAPPPAPVAAPASGLAVVVVGDGGGLPPEEIHAVRDLAMNELSARGVRVSGDPRFATPHPVDASTLAAVRAAGAGRVFVLDVQGRLGAKIPFRFQELSTADLRPVASAALSAESIEEADEVIPRLVDAVLDRVPVSETAQIDNLSASETHPFLKKPGETFFYFGLNIPFFGGGGDSTIFGYSFGYMYEAANWRVGGILEGSGREDRTVFFIGLDGAWLPLKGGWSPYLDGGLGFMSAGNEGVGAKLEAGAEFLRLHGIRLMVGINVHIPIFRAEQIAYPMLALRFGF